MVFLGRLSAILAVVNLERRAAVPVLCDLGRYVCSPWVRGAAVRSLQQGCFLIQGRECAFDRGCADTGVLLLQPPMGEEGGHKRYPTTSGGDGRKRYPSQSSSKTVSQCPSSQAHASPSQPAQEDAKNLSQQVPAAESQTVGK